MAMNAYGVVKGIDVFKHQQVRLLIILNLEAIEPFPFNQGVEGFDAGIVPWIAFLRIAAAHLGCLPNICLRNILAATVRMDNQQLSGFPALFGFLQHLDDAGDVQITGQIPGDDFPGEQIHNAFQIDETFSCPDIGDVAAPYLIRFFRIEAFLKDIHQRHVKVTVTGRYGVTR